MAINSLNAASYGFSGLVSNMDTQSLVEKMLSGTKGKITAQQQKKSQVGYKQTLYREIGTGLLNLQKKYFAQSATSLRYSSLFNSMKASSSSKYFTVTGSSQAQAGTASIDKIMQLAKAAELKSGSAVSGEISGVVSPTAITGIKDKFDEMGKVTVDLAKRVVTKDGDNETITTGDKFATFTLDVSKLAGMSDLDAEREINRQIVDALGNNPGVKATSQNGSFTFTAVDGDGDTAMVKLSGSAGAMKTFAGNDKTELESAKDGSLKVALNTNAMMAHVDISLDGATKKTIYFDSTAYATGGTQGLIDSINKSLKQAFGEAVKASKDSDGNLTFQTYKKAVDTNGNEVFVKDPSRLILFTSNTNDKISEESLKALGLTNGSANKVNQNMKLEDVMFKRGLSPVGGKFEFKINGMEFRFTEDATLGTVMSTINNSNANVKISYSSNEDKFTLSSTVSGEGSQISMEDMSGNLLNSMFDLGAVSGSSGSGTVIGNTVVGSSVNRIIDPATDTLSSLGINDAGIFTVQAGTEKVAFTVNPGDTLQTMMSNMKTAITSAYSQAHPGASTAGIDVTFDSSSGKLKITGVDEPLSIRAGAVDDTTTPPTAEDKAASRILFGTESSFSFGAVKRELSSGKELKLLSDGTTLADGTTRLSDLGITSPLGFTFTAPDGTVHTATVPGEAGDLSVEGVRDYMQTQLRSAYTAENPSGDATAIKVNFADGKFSVTGFGGAEDGWKINVSDQTSGNPFFTTTEVAGVAADYAGSAMTIKAQATDTLGSAGIGTGANPADQLTFEIGGKKIQFASTDTMADVAAGLEAFLNDPTNGPGFTGATVAFNASTSKFEINGVKQDATMNISGTGAGKLFGSNTVDFTVSYSGDVTVAGGQNAKFMFNGEVVERSSNSFTVDGLSFTLLDTTHQRNASGEILKDPTTNEELFEGKQSINVTRDTEPIMEALVGFVEEYNKINKRIYELLTEEPNYKDYPPLTDEQKSAMSDREVELWEEKAKEGLLRSDATLQSVQNALRSTLYKRPEGCAIALYDLGITTASYSDTATPGQLVVDADRLKATLAENPEAVRELFVSSGDGLGDLLDKAINFTASSSYGSPGLLTQMAGATGKADSSSKIYKETQRINQSLRDLADKYDMEYSRYWKQFNTMEQMIQQMNSQSSWLTQSLGG